jgi:hypothetical protein
MARNCKGNTGMMEDLRLFIIWPVYNGNYARKGRRKMDSDGSTIIRQQRARSIMKLFLVSKSLLLGALFIIILFECK